jgi:hypothetical protein
MVFTKEIFKLLGENKKLPAYQAERRIDIFINIFLEDILKILDPELLKNSVLRKLLNY